MKKQITRALLGFAAALMLAAAAHAQTARRIAVQVPFDFVAGQKHLAAGRYTIRRAGTDPGSALLIQSEDGRDGAVLVTNAGDAPPAGARLIFRRHGERFFLASVSIPGTGSVREVPESRAEKKLASELSRRAKAGAADDSAPKTVTVAGDARQ